MIKYTISYLQKNGLGDDGCISNLRELVSPYGAKIHFVFSGFYTTSRTGGFLTASKRDVRRYV